MSKPIRNFEVPLSYDAATQSWLMALGKGRPIAPQQFPAISIPYGYEGQITFTIVGSSNVTFAQNNPFLAAPVTNPPSKPTSLDPQFTATLSGDRKQLVVKDLNGVPNQPQKGYDGGQFNYVINFANAAQIDPIISNGGCCKPTGSGSFLASPWGIAAMVVLAALLVLAVVKGRKRAVVEAPAADPSNIDDRPQA